MRVLIQQRNRAIVNPLTMLPMILFDPLLRKTILLVDEKASCFVHHNFFASSSGITCENHRMWVFHQIIVLFCK